MWGRTLRDYDARAIEFGFEQYLRYGQPFMPKPSDIVRHADTWRPAEGEKRSNIGCPACQWTGWDTSTGKAVKCECRTNSELRTARPMPERMDLGEIAQLLLRRLETKDTAISKEK